jgi:hypothetical protein
MDLSKLPKLSDTQAQTPPAAKAPQDSPVNAQVTNFQTGVPNYQQPGTPYPPQMGLAETWISIGVGVFLLMFYPRFLQWASSRLFHTHFDEFMLDGAVVPYQTLHGVFFSDLGPTLLGIILIVDGLLLFTKRPTLILLAFALTFASTAFNILWVFASYSKYGLAPISFLGGIFGGFILSTQWASYKRLQPRPLNR